MVIVNGDNIEAQINWLGPVVSGRLALHCIHQINWVNSNKSDTNSQTGYS